MDFPALISALRISGLRSKIVVVYPARAKYTAQSEPTNPAPIMVAFFSGWVALSFLYFS
jgi:hypothetical protein